LKKSREKTIAKNKENNIQKNKRNSVLKKTLLIKKLDLCSIGLTSKDKSLI
jgi:hypothetical protein